MPLDRQAVSKIATQLFIKLRESGIEPDCWSAKDDGLATQDENCDICIDIFYHGERIKTTHMIDDHTLVLSEFIRHPQAANVLRTFWKIL